MTAVDGVSENMPLIAGIAVVWRHSFGVSSLLVTTGSGNEPADPCDVKLLNWFDPLFRGPFKI